MSNPLSQPCKQCEAAGITEPPSAPLDPLPYVDKEDGPGNHIRQSWPDAWTEFDPRAGYEQNQLPYWRRDLGL